MANRDVSVAICGAVVGVILGAGSLGFSQDALQGSTVQDIIKSRRAEVQTYGSRDVYKRLQKGELSITPPVRRSGAPTVKPDPVAEDVKVEKESYLTICRAVREVLDRVAAAHKKYLPTGNDKYVETNQGLAATLRDLREDTRYCSGIEAEEVASSSSSSSAPAIDNNCGNYKGMRYTVCRLYERKGQIYN